MVRHNTLAYAKQCLCQRLSTMRLSVSCEQVGEGEFGTVHRAKWYGTIVAVKILRRSDAVAVGDFRCLSSSLSLLQKPYLHVFQLYVIKACWLSLSAPMQMA